MATIGQIETFDDSQSDFATYMTRVKLYFDANDVAAGKKVSTLLTLIGPKTYQLLQDLLSPEAPSTKNLQQIEATLKKHLSPEPLIIAERFRFHRRTQGDNESIKDFVASLKSLATTCDFGDFLNDALRDKFVCGLKDSHTQRKLLTEENLTFVKAIEIATNNETAAKDAGQLKGKEHTVYGVRFKKTIKDCNFCGSDHPRGQCPAWGTRCGKCKGNNHYTKQCETVKQRRPRSRSNGQRQYSGRNRSRSRSRNRNSNFNRKKVHKVKADDEMDFSSLSIHATQKTSASRGTMLKAVLQVRSPKQADLHVQVDSAAEANLLPVRCFEQLYGSKYVNEDKTVDSNCPALTPRPFSRLSVYGGGEIPHFGTVELNCSLDGVKETPVKFYVCQRDGPILLGLEESCRLNLIHINKKHVEYATVAVVNARPPVNAERRQGPIHNTKDLISMYPDRFKGIGTFDQEAKLQLEEGTTPVVHAPRRCPIHLKGEIQAALNDMEVQGIIEKLPDGQPTEWLSSLAYARKSSGKLRVCLDPGDLNNSLKRTYHRAPTLEEVTHRLSRAKVFSKLDARHGYWSIKLDDQSSLLTAFSSPATNVRYVFKRLPFGLCVSQDLFQEAMDRILKDLDGVISIADDIITFGSDDEDHDRHIHRLMQRAAEQGLVFNEEKCLIKAKKISFFGATYGADGVRPDSERTREIAELPVPKDKHDVQSFLGIVQYLSPFIPHLSDMTAPLRGMLKKDVQFTWSSTQQDAFDALKARITSATTLNYFDPKLKTKIQVDASLKGLGAALIQTDPKEPDKERVVAFASKSLTDTETRYANIEREFLAVVFGVERFHTYVYGDTFEVESDHKPLEAIQLKNLAQAPPRLQRMMLRLQPYNLTVRYRKGSEMQLADFLSRYHPRPGKTIHMDKTIHAVQWSNPKLESLRQETKTDPVLAKLTQIIQDGWPSTASELPKDLKSFWSLKDYLSIEDGIILKGHQVLVPTSLQEDILEQLHSQCHQGVEKTRLLARRCIFWPNINSHIADKVGSCQTCNTFQNSQPPEPMVERDIPSVPWQMLGTDLFDYGGHKYLLLVDYYSKFLIVRQLQKENSTCVIRHLKQIFSEQGIPARLYSDNGPCYASQEFSEFASTYSFDHITSSPNYQQSNGVAERYVQTAKGIMKKCEKSKTDVALAFLLFRTTPIASGLPSPAELLLGRQVKSTLPFTVKEENDHKEALRQRQQIQKKYYDRGTTELSELKPGQPVMLQSHKDLTWKPATVVTPTKEPRSYVVQTTDGARYRRNRRFIRNLPNATPTQETTCEETTSETDTPRQTTEAPSPTRKKVTFQSTEDKAEVEPVRRSSRQSVTPTRLITEM
jgi:transposase InsO family protein